MRKYLLRLLLVAVLALVMIVPVVSAGDPPPPSYYYATFLSCTAPNGHTLVDLEIRGAYGTGGEYCGWGGCDLGSLYPLGWDCPPGDGSLWDREVQFTDFDPYGMNVRLVIKCYEPGQGYEYWYSPWQTVKGDGPNWYEAIFEFSPEAP
jgi:hypothetical protein